MLHQQIFKKTNNCRLHLRDLKEDNQFSKNEEFKTWITIMLKHDAHLQINAIILVGITTFIPKIFSLENYSFQNQRYDYDELIKEAVGGRAKDQTTRIFTTDEELDEKFWLKYLGEDYHHAVHIKVDSNNKVHPVAYIKPPTKPTLNYKPREEKRSRFVRQPTHDCNNKQLPVENLYDQYPTEKPETFNDNPSTRTTTATTSSPVCTKYKPSNIQIEHNCNKPPPKHKEKLLRHGKLKEKLVKVKSPRTIKDLEEPIVVNLPETDNSVHYINDDNLAVIVQIPPFIYHQKAHFYPEKNSNLPFIIHNNQLYSKHNAVSSNQNMHTIHSHNIHLLSDSKNPLYKQQQLLSPTNYRTHSQIKQPYPYRIPFPPSQSSPVLLSKKLVVPSLGPRPTR